MSLLDDNLDIDIKVLWKAFIKDFALNNYVNGPLVCNKLEIKLPNKSIKQKSKYVLAYKYTNREFKNTHITIHFIHRDNIYKPDYGYPIYVKLKSFASGRYTESSITLETVERMFYNRNLIKDLLYEPTR
jgi:hypothetical protein